DVDLGGPGGGWNESSNSVSARSSSVGASLVKGGLGGIGCSPENQTHGNGGFGGGGGGCLTGGGGGGYIGGNTGHKELGNGEGGYSYATNKLTHVHFQPAINHGPGEVYIIPAISGCGCDFRCVSLDRHLSETKCLCPPGWFLSNDSISCVMANESKVTHQTYMILLIAASIGLLFAFTAVCLLLYNRYQSRKALLQRRQVMFGNGTELTSLRAVSDTMMTEFNPNYEFAGNLYSFKDLPQIPRECITLDPDVIKHPTPNFDILPICEREVSIVRPDPETECINVQSELDACGYMQPRIIDPRSASQRMAQAIAGNNPNARNENFANRTNSNERNNVPPTEIRNPYGPTSDTTEQTVGGNASRDDFNHENDHTEKKHNADSSNRDEKSVHRTSTDIENSGKLKIADNGNNRPTDIECRRSSTAEVTDVDKRNGNESVTTTDTNSDSLIVASSDTPPDTTNSSPNTRTCSPSHAGLNTNATNVNGMLKKNALKAALSLDPSALCRGTIPYEKIAFSPPPQRSSTPGSMEIKKVKFF
ncbi:hypothetical protein E2986_07868, partial [Frieseomelitta varia]